MKLRIEKEFTDKYTSKKYKVGDEVEFKDERAKELLSDFRELVTRVKEQPKEEADKTTEKPAKKSKK